MDIIRVNIRIYDVILYRKIGQSECSFFGTINIDFCLNKNYHRLNNYYYLSALALNAMLIGAAE